MHRNARSTIRGAHFFFVRPLGANRHAHLRILSTDFGVFSTQEKRSSPNEVTNKVRAQNLRQRISLSFSLSVLQKMLFFAYCFAVFNTFCTFAACIERCTHSYLLKFPDEPLSRRELKSNETHPWERTLLCVGFIIGCVGFSGPVRDM